jgi:hypothetical protein
MDPTLSNYFRSSDAIHGSPRDQNEDTLGDADGRLQPKAQSDGAFSRTVGKIFSIMKCMFGHA